MTQPVFDRQDQYDRVVEGLLDGETILAVYDCKGSGTGFVGITDRRVVLQDNSFIGGRVAVTSIPLGRINAVSLVSDKSAFGKFSSSSEVHFNAGGRDYTAEFRGADKARHAHDLILWSLTRR